MFSLVKNPFLYIILLLSFASIVHASANPFESNAPFKEGIIHYTITGNKQGIQTNYLRNFGKEQIIYQNATSKIMHENNASEHIIMITPQWTYHINSNTNEAIKERSLKSILIEKFKKLSKSQQQSIIQRRDKTILGIPTVKTSINGTQSYFSKDGHILLHAQTHIMGYNAKISATHIEEKSVNQALFILPEKLQIVETRDNEKKADAIIYSLLEKRHHRSEEKEVDYHSIIQEGIQALEF